MSNIPHPQTPNLSFYEQRFIERLYRKHGNDWKRIAKQLPGRFPSQIKTYWLKKTRLEKMLKEELDGVILPQIVKHNTNAIVFGRYREMCSDPLYILSHVCSKVGTY